MVSLNFKSILLGFGGAVAMTAVLASVQMYQPAKKVCLRSLGSQVSQEKHNRLKN